MAGKTYRVRISRGEEQFEAEGDRAFVLKMYEKFEAGEGRTAISVIETPRAGQPSRKPDITALASSKGVSAGEFIRQLGFKKHTDLVVAFGFYLEQHTGAKAFTAADINTCYYEAKMEPSNISQSIVQNFKRGYIMVAKGTKNTKGAKKNYTLTASGEAFVKNIMAKTPKAK